MFLGGGMKPFLRCSTLQQQPAEITMASSAGTWMELPFIFVPWITGPVLIQLWRRLLIFGCSELDGFFALGASLTAWLADGALAHDLVRHARRHSALPSTLAFCCAVQSCLARMFTRQLCRRLRFCAGRVKMWLGPSVHASDWERFAA